MKNSSLRPLNQSEQEFAEKYHGLVYTYLFKRGLSVEDFYDIVIFGYLRAIARYHDQKKCQQYSFTTIAWRSMDCEYGNYMKSLRTQKRKETLKPISLNEVVGGTENCTFGDIIPALGEIYDELEYREFFQETVSLLPFLQRKLLYMKLNGNTKREIKREMKLSV